MARGKIERWGVAAVALAVACLSGAALRADEALLELATAEPAELGELESQGGGPKKMRQIAFVTRAESDVQGLVRSKAESLQKPHTGIVIGDLAEQIVGLMPEPGDPTGTRQLLSVRDVLTTDDGMIFWEGNVSAVLAADGALVSTSTPFATAGAATISGGTGEYHGITGTATLAGRISICVVGVQPFCTASDNPMLPPGLGLRYENHWILRFQGGADEDGEAESDELE